MLQCANAHITKHKSVNPKILSVAHELRRQYSQLPLRLALHLLTVHPEVFQLLRGNGVVHGCSDCPEKEPESRPAAGRFRSLHRLDSA